MQSDKESEKRSKIADKSVAAAPEKTAAAEITAKPRTQRSSKAKKSEEAEMTSGKHHHKLASATAAKEVSLAAPAAAAKRQPMDDAPIRTVRREDIAELAYSYFAARGYTQGSAEEDWFRAERELGLR